MTSLPFFGDGGSLLVRLDDGCVIGDLVLIDQGVAGTLRFHLPERRAVESLRVLAATLYADLSLVEAAIRIAAPNPVRHHGDQDLQVLQVLQVKPLDTPQLRRQD